MNNVSGDIRKKSSYQKLQRKLFFRTLMLLLISTSVVILLRQIFKGKVANTIVNIISTLTGKDWADALQIYRNWVYPSLDIIIIITILVLFFIVFRIFLSWFTKYFDQIIDGIDNLENESPAPISMSPELDFLEKKLTNTKAELSKRANEIRETEQKKNELIIYLAHDIKTPLTSVIGYLSLLDESKELTIEERAEYTHIALEKAYRLETLINEFFEITRYNLKSIPLDKEPINLYYMMVQIAEELYPLLLPNKQTIRFDIPENLEITVDPNKVARMINNILKNAIAYGDKNSEIIVATTDYSDETVIEIINEGTIPQEKLSTIFEKFIRLDEARTNITGGAGLGLAIAKDIVELHGGKIEASNSANCAVFTIHLPK